MQAVVILLLTIAAYCEGIHVGRKLSEEDSDDSKNNDTEF